MSNWKLYTFAYVDARGDQLSNETFLADSVARAWVLAIEVGNRLGPYPVQQVTFVGAKVVDLTAEYKDEKVSCIGDLKVIE